MRNVHITMNIHIHRGWRGELCAIVPAQGELLTPAICKDYNTFSGELPWCTG